jgi:RHS repeat-associated protein
VDAYGSAAEIDRDGASRVTVNRLANGVRASFSYDDANQVLRLANVKSDGTTLSSFGYLYDKVGNRTRVVEANGDRVSWIYDNLNQLTAERRSGANAYANTYAYDPVANRTRMLKSASPTTYLYDVANQLTRFQDSTGYTTNTWDGCGNLARTLNPSNQRTTNTWDGESRLTRVALPTGVRNTFAYNGDGLRVQKQDSAGTTKHVWDGQNIILETDASNIIQAVYSLEPVIYGNLVSQRRSGATSYYLFDALGSTRQLADSTGSVTDSYLYDSLGNGLFSSGTTSNFFRYVGRPGYYYGPDLAKLYLRARTYDPASGRFLSRDPLAYAGEETNLYRYALNSPVNFTDPSGYVIPFPEICCAACIITLVSIVGLCISGCLNAPGGAQGIAECVKDCVILTLQLTPAVSKATLVSTCVFCRGPQLLSICTSAVSAGVWIPGVIALPPLPGAAPAICAGLLVGAAGTISSELP